MNFMHLLDMILHVDTYLKLLIAQYGTLIYVVLFAVVFGETGVVLLFFLPGDTLLFVSGALCATHAMDIRLLLVLLSIAAISGSTMNYMLGSYIGHKVYSHNYRWLDQAALRKTHTFYEKYGGMTMVLSRFVPAVRTFAPFVAGVSEMTFRKFQAYNIAGAVLWVILLATGGFFFGNIPVIRDHLNAIVLAGTAVAIVPVALGTAWRFTRKIMRR